MFSSVAKLTLHTNDAIFLFKGSTNRSHRFIPGFLYTQKHMNHLYAMGMAENPFAEGALIEIDMRLAEADELTHQIIASCQKGFDEAKEDGISLQLLTNIKPKIYRLKYASEYTIQMAKMITRTDKAFRYIRTVTSGDYHDPDVAKEQIKSLMNKVRMVYERINMHDKHILPGVTREDLKKGSALAKSMVDKMGEPHASIISKKVTFKMQRISELAL